MDLGALHEAIADTIYRIVGYSQYLRMRANDVSRMTTDAQVLSSSSGAFKGIKIATFDV